MVQSIDLLRDYGIFRNYIKTDAKDFGRLNLIYGWNGSGKSTLSSLFEQIENRQNTRYPNSTFSIKTFDQGTITKDNIFENNLNLKVFNQNFINKNIDWNNSVKSILLIAQEKIEEKKKLEELRTSLDKKTKEYVRRKTANDKLTDELQKFLTDAAKRTKTSLQVIDTSDSRFLSYNRTKLENFITSNVDLIKKTDSILDINEVARLTKAANPTQKPAITTKTPSVDSSLLKKAQHRLNELFKQSVTNKVIESLKHNQDIQSWVFSGLNLNLGSDSCHFCGNKISQERIDELNAHFNDEYRKFSETLDKAKTWLTSQFIVLASNSDIDIYDEHKDLLKEKSALLKDEAEKINSYINEWEKTLDEKITNPFNIDLFAVEIPNSLFINFNQIATEINKIIEMHNKKCKDFKEETYKVKSKLESHYAASEVNSFDYFRKISNRDAETKNLQTNDNDLKKIKAEIKSIEDSLSNETIAADIFNKHLHGFLGRSELSLQFNKEKNGYEILRDNQIGHAPNLSEGEKTAIALIYFITKLTENDNKISDSIIVFDDPVSSFDSNHLFHSYSFIKTYCNDAKQLFLLTHNFTFFKLARDWFNTNNKNRKRKEKVENAFFYTIEPSAVTPRSSAICNADPSLIDYNSEYHYIFDTLYKHKEHPRLTREQAFFTANLSRKLLESFLNFKYPKHRSDLSQLMDVAAKNCVAFDSNKKEKVYRFINKYSHSAVIEMNEDIAENLIGEGTNVIGDIFLWIEEIDKVHYDEMVSVCQKN
ncbi:AAA family ATPase [Klebsiella variicola]|uniref:AAA family ATPase n=2 Tax=Klebsiella pneumoniae complex TaxID=3390273 RepID=UPI002FE304C2|nr:AAA family ATPase [Klebsiella variicola]HBW0893303.1 AAA family ATPase [Klebsiella variicola]HCI5655646.1 AAA family ATPase [Klebsiella variicola subsp. variicola]